MGDSGRRGDSALRGLVPELSEDLILIRVAFTVADSRVWTGGYNYLLNLVRALSKHASGRVTPVLCFTADAPDEDIVPFAAVAGAQVLRHPAFNEARKGFRLSQALLTGRDAAALGAFSEQRVDVAFEAAQFFGWRFPIPAIAWVPDFQHRHLKRLFGRKAYWRREMGFRAQVMSGRPIILSSEDARLDCERFYPATRGRTHVVRFAIEPTDTMSGAEVRAITSRYGLPGTFFYLPNQFWVHKNHECVIEALRLLAAEGSDVVVVASGLQVDVRDPGHFGRLRALIAVYGLEYNFRLLGLIPHSDVLALMRSCVALINPSLFEGWSTTVEEAKAIGTPMILSSLRVHWEQTDGNAMFFDPGSPRQLADALSAARPLGEAERAVLLDRSRVAAAAAVRDYAEGFCGVVESTAHR